MSVTIKDVAKNANVSIATVSRVLAGKKEAYSSSTERKVKKAIRELGYKKNTAAVELVTMHSNVIAVLVPTPKTNFAMKIIDSIQKGADMKNLNVIILFVGDNDEKMQIKALNNVIERPVNGILLISVELFGDAVNLLKNSDIPHVFVSTAIDKESQFVSSDDFKIGYEATKFLIEKGHKKIGLSSLEKNSFIGRQRVSGYLAALNDYHLQHSNDWIVEGDYSYESGFSAMQHYKENTDITAVIGASDLVAIGIINAAKQLNINVPNQLAVVSIDGTYLVDIVSPRVTSVTQSFFTMGETALNMLFADENAVSNYMYIPFKIDEREST
ncbi:LacI family transcriptional regulator [Leuconostoc carnosum]|uniref:LacI family transcription regulator n=2 Tax=Leuconostoc carnosum TaxID=1252 RepID=K0DCQ4_LEUCJ|nr:LacI family DNA-binding transcriptional regulator [Leuconostoc carnosum]AFT81721.1 LacI family transcription regulator [Leuconostoc carnosum JB16]KAA8328320.1 LacI family transcriptional regulator [Leuconostoc carnosum]QEA32790.1 LacI family transcriptional regulator [Leuconostoc carnosum]